MYIANVPVFFFWLVQALRARDVFFFAAVNPAIPTGGFFGEEKHKIYALIPPHYLPKMVFLQAGTSHEEILSRINASGLTYPMVCKPDVGERGMHVKIVHDEQALHDHVSKMTGGVIVQEYISYPLELSILCHRFPNSSRKAVTSICRKAFLSVTGDGVSTLAQLIQTNPRAILQKNALSKRMDLNAVPAKEEEVLLEAIGNHCRGTQFLNANEWINPDVEKTILSMLDQMEGVHYGRFDLRTSSVEDLEAGKNFLVMEFNGVGSEPAHIYDPSYPLRHAYRDIWRHWQILYFISREQKKGGVSSMPLKQGLASLRTYFSYKKKATLAYEM